MDAKALGRFLTKRTLFLKRRAEDRAKDLGRGAGAPEADPDDMLLGSGGIETPPLVVHITYRDTRSNISGRCVTIKTVRDMVSDIQIGCYCHLRRTYRSFLASRVVEVVELTTGEVFQDGVKYFRHHPLLKPAPESGLSPPAAHVLDIRDCRDAIVLLSFLASADGEFNPLEEDQIVSYVLDEACSPDVGEEDIRSAIRGFAPDRVDFENSLERLCSGDRSLNRFRTAVRRLVDADGVLDEAEFAFAGEIESRLTASGRL